MTDPCFTHQVTEDVVTTTLIDHEPEPDQAAQSRDRHLSDLAGTIAEMLNGDPEAFMIVRGGSGFNAYVELTQRGVSVIARLLKENL